MLIKDGSGWVLVGVYIKRTLLVLASWVRKWLSVYISCSDLFLGTLICTERKGWYDQVEPDISPKMTCQMRCYWNIVYLRWQVAEVTSNPSSIFLGIPWISFTALKNTERSLGLNRYSWSWLTKTLPWGLRAPKDGRLQNIAMLFQGQDHVKNTAVNAKTYSELLRHYPSLGSRASPLKLEQLPYCPANPWNF